MAGLVDVPFPDVDRRSVHKLHTQSSDQKQANTSESVNRGELHKRKDAPQSQARTSSPSEPCEDHPEDARHFFRVLDDLEAARPREAEDQTVPGNRAGIWDDDYSSLNWPARKFDHWADEADDLEATATMPEGTRYYKAE